MKKALVIFSGGQDSTVCLLQAINEYGRENVEAISFNYGQRHSIELQKAHKIVVDLGVAQSIVNTTVLQQTTRNALIDGTMPICASRSSPYPNTFVDGRNVLFLLLSACHAKQKGVRDLIIGVSQVDYSGYPDCRDTFIKSMNVTLNLSFDYCFTIKTPLMYLTKKQIWQLADELGYLNYVINETHTCYDGIEGGCHRCPSCLLREEGLHHYLKHKAAST